MDLRLLGNRVRFLRRTKGLEQRELAAASGVHQTTISRLERGLVERPAVNDVVAISKALGVSLSELLPQEPEDKGLTAFNPLGEIEGFLARCPDTLVALAQISNDLTDDDMKFIQAAIDYIRQRRH
jgi:transcriptional regulator with XRE-family HTH domain